MADTTNRRFTRPAVVVLVVAFSVTTRPALGWGRVGHRAASALAESRLSPAARAAVASLLEPGESLADASTWADEVRRELPESAPWHYVNVPITEPKYDARFCPETGCVVSRAAEFRRVLANPRAPRAARQMALRFFVHFVEDLHQPLHVGHRDDRGGNSLQVRFFDSGSNLHAVWDSKIVERAYPDEQAMFAALKALADSPESSPWGGKALEVWASESLEAARVAYRVPGSDAQLKPGSKLADAYQDANLPVARRRLAQAGVRLADALNEVFAKAP